MQLCDVVFNPPETRHDIGEHLPYVSTQLLPLVQPLVGRVELGQCHNQNLHLADGAVTHAGWDHDADAGFDGTDVIIRLHLRSRPALQEVVRLGEPLVICGSR